MLCGCDGTAELGGKWQPTAGFMTVSLVSGMPGDPDNSSTGTRVEYGHTLGILSKLRYSYRVATNLENLEY